MGFSEILPLSECVVLDSRTPTSRSLEPGKVLERIPKEIVFGKKRIFVMLNDRASLVELELSVFLGREYPINGDTLRIGSSNLNIKDLVITVGFKLKVEDLTDITDLTVD
jgi:hypothetical protein